MTDEIKVTGTTTKDQIIGASIEKVIEADKKPTFAEMWAKATAFVVESVKDSLLKAMSFKAASRHRNVKQRFRYIKAGEVTHKQCVERKRGADGTFVRTYREIKVPVFHEVRIDYSKNRTYPYSSRLNKMLKEATA